MGRGGGQARAPRNAPPAPPILQGHVPGQQPGRVEVEVTRGLGEAVPVPELVELSVRTVEAGVTRVLRPEVVERAVGGEASP